MESFITKIKLENFKLFKELEVDNISQFTIIGGKNNIGKTSLLEAIFLLHDFNNSGLLTKESFQS